MGLAIVKGLVSEGVSVLMIARDQKILDSIVLKIKNEGGDVEGFAGDVANSDLAEAVVKFVINKWGR